MSSFKSSFFSLFGSTLTFDGEQLTDFVDTGELVVVALSIFTEICGTHGNSHCKREFVCFD